MTPKQQEEFKDRAKKEAIDKIVGQQEIDEFKTKVQKETIDNIINRIEINDSYFYTKILVENAPIMDNPFGDKVKVYIKINLFDSKEFENENVINSNRKHLKANGIVSEIIIDKVFLSNLVAGSFSLDISR